MKTRRVLLVLLLAVTTPLALMGCDDGSGDGDEDTTTDTVVDTTPDTTADTTPDTTPDTTADTVADTVVDTEPDSTGCVSTTAAAGGICSVLTLCGCDASQVCMLNGVSTDCQLFEECVTTAPGTVPVGEECNYATDCIPGSICVRYSGEEMGHCYRWCQDGSDCTEEGSECNVSLTLTPSSGDCAGTPIETPLNACSLPCPTDPVCDPFGGTGTDAGCDDGEQCGIRSDCNISWCFPQGTVAEGGDCSGAETCVAGTLCLIIDDTTSTCVPYCDSEHACTTGTCNPLSPPYPENTSLGYCY